MTPSYFIDLQGNIPYSFSRITAGSLADLGYTVNLDAADPYTADDMDPSCVCSARSSSSRVGATPLPPPMSDELKKKATEYGQSILRKKHENRRRRLKEMPSLKDKEKGDGVEYVGDRIMFLLLRENNIQYSMIVTQTYDD